MTPKTPYVEWCNGNGTRYALSFTVLPTSAFGHEAGTVMVVGPTCNARSVMFLNPWKNGPLECSYVMEKMNLNMSDGAPVTEMIAVVMGREPVLPRYEDIPDRGDGRKFTLP